MRLVHLQDFGLHKKGEIVVVPDGVEFSPLYFAEVDEDGNRVSDFTLPTVSDEARGLAEPPADKEDEPVALPEHDFVDDEVPAKTTKTTRKGKG